MNSVRLQQTKVKERMDRLTDAYLDRLIDRESFETRKTSLLMEGKALEEKLAQPKAAVAARLTKFLELAIAAPDVYNQASPEEKRELLTILTSNRALSGKNVAITLKPAFQEVANRQKLSIGRPSQGAHRTLDILLEKLIAWFTGHPMESFDLGDNMPVSPDRAA
jgi:hypothetical protein